MTTTPMIGLADMGRRLHELLKTLPDDAAITDTLDYLVGAVYGLMRAVNLGFIDRRGPFDPTYRPFLTKYVLDIVAEREVHHLWRAGFYFNSAIQRLAASYERIPKLLGARGDNPHDRMKKLHTAVPQEWLQVYLEVNSFKHDPEGKAQGRLVTMDIAAKAADHAIRLLERHVRQLVSQHLPPKP